MTSPVPLEVLGFLLGLLFGSFLNVCISRSPEHRSVVKPRSHCPSCGHTIRWYDNLPLLSWLLLRRRCRDCKAAISWRYPAVELALGLWFAVCATRTALEGVGLAILGFLLIGLLVMDWQTQTLPNAFTLPGIVIGFLLVCVKAMFLAPGEGDIVLNTTRQLRMTSPGSFAARGNVFLTGTEAMVMGRIAAIAGAALILLAVRWIYKAFRKRDGLGLGDVKLLAMIAAFLGFGETVLALFVGMLSASLYGVFLIFRRGAVAETKLPLGSFLSAGGLLAALFGPRIIHWYASLLR